MKSNTTSQFFVVFGVTLLILVVVGFFFLLSESNSTSEVSSSTQRDTAAVANTQRAADTETSTTDETSASGFALSSAQVEALVSLGIDPAAIPSTVSSEQEACFVEALGEARVEEIKAGVVPNALEFVKAKACI